MTINTPDVNDTENITMIRFHCCQSSPKKQGDSNEPDVREHFEDMLYLILLISSPVSCPDSWGTFAFMGRGPMNA